MLAASSARRRGCAELPAERAAAERRARAASDDERARARRRAAWRRWSSRSDGAAASAPRDLRRRPIARSEPLGVETYFELVFERAAGATTCRPRSARSPRSAARVKLRCGGRGRAVRRAGGARDRLLPRRRAWPSRRPPGSTTPMRRGERARLPQPAGGGGARRAAELAAVLAEEDAGARSSSTAAGRARSFVSFGSCSWREPVDDLRGAGAARVTLAYGVLRRRAASARAWTSAVVDLSGARPAVRRASLNAFMAAGPEVWRAGARPRRGGARGRGRRARHAVRGGRLRGLLLVAPPRDEPRPHVPARTPSRCCRTGATCRWATTAAPGTVVPSGTPVRRPSGQRPGPASSGRASGSTSSSRPAS